MARVADSSKQQEAGISREYERNRLVSYLRVFDANTGLLLGHIADISVGGIKLVSHDPLEPNKKYTLKVILPKEVLGRSELLFYAESCWTKPVANPDFIITGFSYPSLSDEQRGQIEAIHSEFGRDTALCPVASERPACYITNASGR